MSLRVGKSSAEVIVMVGLLAVGAGACGGGGKGAPGGRGGSAGATGGSGLGGATGGPGGAAGAAGGAGSPGSAGGAGGMAGNPGVAGSAGGAMAVDCGAGGFIGTAGSLLSDGGFECPVVPSGSFVNFTLGQQFFGWTVMGAAGSVSPLSGKYVHDVYTWPAHGGEQTIDLTGNGSNAATGISQTIATTPGASYSLSFWVGNLAAPGTIWGATSTVNVLVDGTQVLAAANADGAGSTAITWKQFAATFTATLANTTIAFVNGDPANDESNLLDDVILRPAFAR